MGKQIIVVGGGAAGMIAAYFAAQKGNRVILTEQNEKLGKKLFITGKGRCNVTFDADAETFFASVLRNPKFLYSAYYGFTNDDMMTLLSDSGCPLKTERGGRVFPVSDHSSDIIATLKKLLLERGVEIRLQTRVKEILTGENEEGKTLVKGVLLADGKRIAGDAVIVATGGRSYESTGATGDGYRFAEALQLKTEETKPALVPVVLRESWCRDAMGVSLKNVGLKMEENGRVLYEGFGEMLFTHFGISGPLVLSASSFLPMKKKDGEGRKKEILFKLDLKPALTKEQLDKRLIRDFEEAGKKQFKNALGHLFPAKLIGVMVALSGIDPEKKCNEISREERLRFAGLIKAVPMTFERTRDYDEAIITRGGVSVKEINPSTMEVKKVSGLYFAGEVLDLDALTGGFNLQIAWSTGALAGNSAGTENE